MIKLKTSGPPVMLGLKIDGQRIHAVVIRRAQESLEVEKSLDFKLTLDLLKDNPEHVGAELHQHLENAGIKVSRCIACVPLSWVLTLQTELPDLPPEDLQSFLDVQTEREFPFSPEDLCISLSEYRGAEDKRYATLGAVPRKKIDILVNVLSAANLKLASISIGIPALRNFADRSAPGGGIDLLIGANGFDLQIVSGGGIVALRTLEDIEISERDWDATAVAKQIRITLGELSEETRSSIRQVNIFGPSDAVTSAMDRISPRLERLGLSVTRGELPDPKVAAMLQDVQSICPVLALLLVRQLAGQAPVFEFLPPKVSKFKELSDRFSSGRNKWLGSAAAAVFLIAFVSFQIQSWRLSSLENEWRTIGPVVKEVKDVQGKIRQFRPWFDESPTSLVIAKQLTEAFPETGDVWLKSLKIKSRSEIQCVGSARNSLAFAAVRDKLNSMEQISGLEVPSRVTNERGIDFQFTFSWNGGGVQ